ncbi:MAG: DUF4243 domain-containing protein [Burkholderiales bacterium]|nr:DUF4243 domain-containing protein [Burkholderiales bacterium]
MRGPAQARIDLGASPALRHWLRANAAFDAEYGDRLSNHLPMALMALQRLGADDARLHAYARGYVSRLRPAPPDRGPADEEPVRPRWKALLGRQGTWPAWRRRFARWLQRDGSDAVLHAALPRLLPGCAGAAFHGLIRTAYAVQAGDGQELADALAHWACVWQRLPTARASAGRPTRDPAALLRGLPHTSGPVPGALIADRVAVIAAHPGFAAAVAALQVDDRTLEGLARGAAELYARSGNFTVLHLLTSAHALRVLLPWAGAGEAAVRAYWPAFAAAWAASGARERGALPLLPWGRITAAAIASDDDHRAKLVDSCLRQQRAYGGAVWRAAASRAVAAA